MTRATGRSFLSNTIANMSVGAASLAYGVVVPAVVVRRFGTEAYGSWYLAFQVAAYVLLLDLGSQYLVSNAASAQGGRGRPARLATAAIIAQAGLAVLVVAGATVWAGLTGQGDLARLMALLGVAAASSLLASTVRSWFGGLRRAHVPAVWLVAARAGSMVGVVAAAAAGRGLVTLTAAAAAPQVVVHVAFLAWAHRPPSPWAAPDRQAFTTLARSGLPLALWTVCGVVIGGVDIFVVRALEPSDVGFYALALPLLAIPTGAVTAAMAAWMPYVRARAQSPVGDGGRDLTLAGTALMTGALAAGAVVFVGHADGLVSLLAGVGDWGRAATYLRLLYLATAIRFVFLPWVILIVVRDEQARITPAAVAEAVANLGFSILLGVVLGGLGVALGTTVGALVAAMVNLTRSVRRTADSGISAGDLLRSCRRAWPAVAAAAPATVLGAAGAAPVLQGAALGAGAVAGLRWLVIEVDRARRPTSSAR